VRIARRLPAIYQWPKAGELREGGPHQSKTMMLANLTALIAAVVRC